MEIMRARDLVLGMCQSQWEQLSVVGSLWVETKCMRQIQNRASYQGKADGDVDVYHKICTYSIMNQMSRARLVFYDFEAMRTDKLTLIFIGGCIYASENVYPVTVQWMRPRAYFTAIFAAKICVD